MREIKNLDETLVAHKRWLSGDGGARADLSDSDLSDSDLRNADLSRANLSGANLSGANLDYSCLPLWCGSLSAHFDDRHLAQIAYHLVRAGIQSGNASEETKRELEKLADFASTFHRVSECGKIFIRRKEHEIEIHGAEIPPWDPREIRF